MKRWTCLYVTVELRAQTSHPKVGADTGPPTTTHFSALPRWSCPAQAAGASWDECHRGPAIHQSPLQVRNFQEACVAPSTSSLQSPNSKPGGTAATTSVAPALQDLVQDQVAAPGSASPPGQFLTVGQVGSMFSKASREAMGYTLHGAQYTPKSLEKKLIAQRNNRMPIFIPCQCETWLKAKY